MKKDKSLKKRILIVLFWLAVWQIIAMLVAKPLLFPSPVQTLEALLELLKSKEFYLDILATFGRCVAAILLATGLGFALALLSYKSNIVRLFLSPLVALFKAIPVMALAIYFIFMFASGKVPILVCFVTCFPIVYTNLLTGFDNIDAELLEMASMYDIKGFAAVRYINMPSLYPYFFSATKLIVGISWKAIVTAEVLSVPQLSIGYELMNAKYYLETAKLFAYVATIIVLSVLFEKIVIAVLEKCKPHPYSYSSVERSLRRKSYTVHPGDAIVIEGVSKAFEDKPVLDKVKLAIPSGKNYALMSASGSGKTTLLRIISGLETADEGKVSVKEPIGYLFQEDRLIPWLNIYDNLAIVCNDRDKIEELLENVNLSEDKYKLPEQLSGGMNHRVALARAFIFGAGTMLFDEPFRGLDEETRDVIIEKLWQPNAIDKTVLMVTHDQDLAEKLADRIISK